MIRGPEDISRLLTGYSRPTFFREFNTHFPSSRIDFEDRSEATYPHIIHMNVGQSQFLGIGIWHFGSKDNWQFDPMRNILNHAVNTVKSQPDQKWLAIYEGPPREFNTTDSLETALITERDPGMFLWFMGRAGVPALSAEMPVANEVRLLLQGTDIVPEKFSPDLIAHHYACRIGGQFLSALREGTDYGDYMTYVNSRIDKTDLRKVAHHAGLDLSEASLRKTHKRVIAEAGIDLPFDPHDVTDTITPEIWNSVFFIPSNIPAEAYGDYKSSFFTDAQRLGSTVRTIYYNLHLANLFSTYLNNGTNIIAVSGGAHIARSVDNMTEGITQPAPICHIGVDKCLKYIEKVN